MQVEQDQRKGWCSRFPAARRYRLGQPQQWIPGLDAMKIKNLAYSDGSPIYIGDRVILENNELATVYAIFLSAKGLGLSDAFNPSEEDGPGVLVVTDRGAQVVYLELSPNDIRRDPNQ